MKVAQTSQYRKQLGKYHRHVIEDSDPLYIPGKAGTVVVLSAADYENLVETMRVMSDRVTMKSLSDTAEKLARGEKAGISMEEAFSDLLDA